MRKNLSSLAIAAVLVGPVLAAPGEMQPPSREMLEKNRDKKLQEPFLEKAPWITDIGRAQEEAVKTGKPIFAYFTRSYAY